MKKTEYFIDIKKQTLFKQEKVISNQKATEILSVEEVEISIFNNKVQKVFVCTHETERESYLSFLSLDEIKMKWNTQYKQNISVDNEVYLEEFPGEYCFFVELWEGKSGEKILVLYEQH